MGADAVRVAALALLEAEDACTAASENYMKMPEGWRDSARLVAAGKAVRKCKEELRTALAAPQPTADERVAEHMRLVSVLCRLENVASATSGSGRAIFDAMTSANEAAAAVEQSARALLSASQEDAEHAAMYRWLRERGGASWTVFPEGRSKPGMPATGEYYDLAVLLAMKETK